MQLKEIVDYIHETLEVSRFRDYCPNGLQVEGRAEIRRIVGGVTANQALIDAALARGADAILVHHGWFWKGEEPSIVGIKKQRLQRLLACDVSLLAYHLPLDAHPVLGNNAGLAEVLQLEETFRCGEQGLLSIGLVREPRPLMAWGEWLEGLLAHRPLLIGEPSREIQRVAWCTGSAGSYFSEAIAAGVDAFVTGEISEPLVHLARESGVAYIAAGHHATERFGVQRLGKHLAERFVLDFEFIEVSSPV